MKLDEALSKLRAAGAQLIKEDTETHDDEEFPLILRRREIRNKADKEGRNLNDKEWKEIDKLDRQIDKIPDANRSLMSKINRSGIFAIKVIASSDEDRTLGYLRNDGTVSRKFNDDCMLSYDACWDFDETYTVFHGDQVKPRYEKAWKEQFKITDKKTSIFLKIGVIKNGKFYANTYYNSIHGKAEDL